MDKNIIIEIIDFTKNWKGWLEKVEMSGEDKIGQNKLIAQMEEALKKWEQERDKEL